MMVTASRVSTIERVPAMMIALLEQAGDLPTMPDAYAVQEGGRGFRRPRVEDGAALTWVLAWMAHEPMGLRFASQRHPRVRRPLRLPPVRVGRARRLLPCGTAARSRRSLAFGST